jgi:BolA protein
MDIQQQIEYKLTKAFEPVHLEVIDESHEHKVPKGSKTHFRVIIVSSMFSGMHRIDRHKKIYRVLLVELDGLIKALSILTFGPEEWADRPRVLPQSPPCLGGSRHDTQAKTDMGSTVDE